MGHDTTHYITTAIHSTKNGKTEQSITYMRKTVMRYVSSHLCHHMTIHHSKLNRIRTPTINFQVHKQLKKQCLLPENTTSHFFFASHQNKQNDF
jgi:hypothetical protein